MNGKVVRKTTMTLIKCPACSSFFRMDGPSITSPFDVPETIEIPFLGGDDGQVVLPPGFVYQKHGRWEWRGGIPWCSNCKKMLNGYSYENNINTTPFCSFCGAKMAVEVIQ